MEDGSRTQLEAHWRNIDAQYSYGEWEGRRKDDWQRILSQRLPELGRSIAVDSGLFTYLQSKAVFDRRTIETFKQEAGTYAQVSSVLHALNKRSFDGFVAFCECLIETGQAAVIVEFLTPELHELRELRQQQPSLNLDVRHVAAQDTASSQLLAVVDLRQAEQEDEEAAAAPTAPAMVVDYDWKSVIRENFMQLTRHVDPDSGLLNQLQSRGVISHVSADVIRSKKGRVNRVGAILDHVTLFRPEADFVKLCEALAATNQQHVVDLYLTKDALQAADQGSVPAEIPSRTAVSTLYNTEENLMETWSSVLIQNRSAIIESLDSSDDFVGRLVMYGVMNFATGELCREESDVVARSEFILDHMQRRASVDMAYFCQALDDTAQHHVVVHFFQKPANAGSSAASASNEPENA